MSPSFLRKSCQAVFPNRITFVLRSQWWEKGLLCGWQQGRETSKGRRQSSPYSSSFCSILFNANIPHSNVFESIVSWIVNRLPKWRTRWMDQNTFEQLTDVKEPKTYAEQTSILTARQIAHYTLESSMKQVIIILKIYHGCE